MPKKKMTDREWNERLSDYANNKFKFGQGQKPPKTSKWAKVIAKIDLCPLKNGKLDALGRNLICDCNFHVKKVRKFIKFHI
jgi:hypothetical protein